MENSSDGRRAKLSEAQIAFVLKQVEDGTSVDEVCRKTGISEATYRKYAGLMPLEIKRLDAASSGPSTPCIEMAVRLIAVEMQRVRRPQPLSAAADRTLVLCRRLRKVSQ